MSDLHDAVLDWYDDHARELPWRGPDASAWSVMVSEFMLQQTPVARVLPVHAAWLERWPTPAALAAEPTGEAVRMWGRLGYPRRALRLHAAAGAIVERFGGEVPASYDDLLASARGRRLHRLGDRQLRLRTAPRRPRHQRATGAGAGGRRAWSSPLLRSPAPNATSPPPLLPDDVSTAATWAVATMELGALVCTARTPRCADCPIADSCAWRGAGFPAYDGPPRRGQAWAGTDRQCRGRLMAVLRDSPGPVHRSRLDAVWSDADQRERCLVSLVADGLVAQVGPQECALP